MEILLLLGGDLGDVQTTFSRASDLINARIGPVRARSRDHWTEPWGFRSDRLFLNRALIVETALEPETALVRCLGIEEELGRTRRPGSGYRSRTIDIDILLWGEQTIDRAALRVPHPRMHERAFALAPSADVAPGWPHPVLGETVLALLNNVLRSA